MRVLFATFLVIATFGVVSEASGEQCVGPTNPCTSLVLHAGAAVDPSCASVASACDGTGPTIDITGTAAPTIFLLLRNYERISGVQCAFEWDPTWTLTFGLWECQSNALSAFTPSASGDSLGTITVAFDEISGGTTAGVGMLSFGSAGAGCISLVESVFPFGNHVFDVNSDPQNIQIDAQNWGKVCVGAGGLDTCEAMVAVEARTWGEIKAHYRR